MNKAPKQVPQKKSPIVPALVLAVLVIVAAAGYKALQPSQPASPPPSTTQTSTADNTSSATVHPHPGSVGGGGPTESAPVAISSAPRAAVSISVPEAEPAEPKDLIAGLTNLDGKLPITPEQAQKWKDALQQLVRQGASSVPVIQQYLAQNVDANYAGVSGANALGYNSLRSAMLGALGQIGGPDATQAMLQIMQSSIYPSDIATLASTLDSQAPGQYQQAIIDAVHQQLNLAALDQLGGANVLPLFQVLATEGVNGANITPDLAQYSEKWPYYSSIALASLPDGAGVPSLSQIAQGTLPGNQAAAAQALAELAPQNPQALSALVDLAKGGQLPDSLMSQIAPFLGGREYQLGPPTDPSAGGYLTFHMANGNQDFSAYDSSGALTPTQITQRISIIDQLMQSVPATDSGTQDALQSAKNALVARQK